MLTAPSDCDYAAMIHIIDKIVKENPFLYRSSIGKSCAGREIPAIKIGRAETYALFTAGFHGSEHITTNILLLFLEEISHSYRTGIPLAGINIRRALSGRGIIIVPRVNPDGCEISIHGAAGAGKDAARIAKMCRNDFPHYNANLRGVDINHNFNAGWETLHKAERKSGILGPAPRQYGGTNPESEPETAALCGLCREKNIHHALALHTQGEVIYWAYGDQKPYNSQRMAEIMATSSGYALDAPTGLAVGGGFKDWFITEFGRPAFTVEAGRGKNPISPSKTYDIYATIREMLALSAIM